MGGLKSGLQKAAMLLDCLLARSLATVPTHERSMDARHRKPQTNS